MIAPAVIAHADWGVDRRKRQMATARLRPGGAGYLIASVGPPPDSAAPGGDLFGWLGGAASPGQAMAGFDFPIGLPRAYARAAGICSFPEFLDVIGAPGWEDFGVVARHPGEITLRRPFYPDVPGGTKREHLHLALGLTGRELRRRCEGTDAETLFWTLGGKQVGKGALAGWRLLAAARHLAPGIALWPFHGPLPAPPTEAPAEAAAEAAVASWSRKPTRVSSTSTSGPQVSTPRGGASDARRTGAAGQPACCDGRNLSASAGPRASCAASKRAFPPGRTGKTSSIR
jgi:hypothetical protein